MKENAAVTSPAPFAVRVLSKPVVSSRTKKSAQLVGMAAQTQNSVLEPRPVQREVLAARLSSAMETSLNQRIHEPEDAHLTGGKRSLQRRLLGLSLTSPKAVFAKALSTIKRAG